MKKIYSKTLFIAFALIMVLSCSKDDSSANIVGGVVYRSQVVTIDLPNVTLSNQQYQATFNGLPITLAKSDNHKLFFLVPYSTTLGMQDLVISSLNDITIHYDLQDTVLSESIEVTMESFFANLNTFSQNLDSSPEAIVAQNALNSFNSYYANATIEDKTEIAIIYKANKIMFDKIIQNIDISGKAIDPNALCFGAAVIGMGASIPLLLAPTGATQIAGLVLLAPSVYYAKDCGKPLWNEFVLANFININGILGLNQKNTILVFTNNINSTLPLNTVNRKLISSDASRTESTWLYFFPYFNLLNANIAIANTVIPLVNNLPFVNFGLISQIQLPSSSVVVNTTVNQVIFGKIQFSINHPNLQLVSSSLVSDGQMSMKIKIIGTPTTSPVISTLNYSYTDSFSTFSGTIPISVSNDNIEIVTIGTQIWMTKNLDVSTYRNGDPIPQVQDHTAWAALTTGAWCYNENSTANGTTYGKLYNWYAVNDPRGLAPVGYHVPSDTEWTALTTFLGGENVAGGKMKATTLWASPNTATNSSGFTGLPGGFRSNDGAFSNVGSIGYWWSSSEDGTHAWLRYLFYNEDVATRNYNNKIDGFSVRCLRD